MLPRFLAACSCKAWFAAVAFLLKEGKMVGAILEKLSIVLQKLSKMKYVPLPHPVMYTQIPLSLDTCVQ